MTKKLADFRGQQVMAGLTPSLPPTEAGLFIDGKNVLFAEGSVQPSPGQRLYIPKVEAAPIRGMLEIMDAEPTLYFATLAKLYRYALGDAAATELASGFTGLLHETSSSPATIWSMESFGKWLLATNGIDTPRIYKGATVDVLTDAPAKIQIFAKLQQHVLGFNTDLNENEVVWCSADAPEVWTATTTNSAGDLILRDMGSPIKAAKALGDMIAVYGQDSIHAVYYTGYPFYFGQRKLLANAGAVGKAAVADVDRMHFVFSGKYIYVTDGTQVQPIDGPIHDYVYDDLNRDQLSKVVAWHWKTQQVVAFFWPSADSSSLNRGAAYNYANRNWTILGFARSAVSDASIFGFALAGDDSGNLYIQDLEGTPPQADPEPLTLIGQATITVGAGMNGAGQGGAGGTTDAQG